MGEGDSKELRELVEFLKASGVARFDMERPELKIRLTFASAASAPPAAGAGAVDFAQLARMFAAGAPAPGLAEVAPMHPAGAVPDAGGAAAVPASAAGAPVDEDAGLHIVKSPLVGTFYDAAAPGAEPFVRVGDMVSVGKVLCIVEAMKIMNEIESDATGEVVKIYAKPGQPLEYGQKLFGVRV